MTGVKNPCLIETNPNNSQCKSILETVPASNPDASTITSKEIGPDAIAQRLLQFSLTLLLNLQASTPTFSCPYSPGKLKYLSIMILAIQVFLFYICNLALAHP
jgi:hypothetical protein